MYNCTCNEVPGAAEAVSGGDSDGVRSAPEDTDDAEDADDAAGVLLGEGAPAESVTPPWLATEVEEAVSPPAADWGRAGGEPAPIHPAPVFVSEPAAGPLFHDLAGVTHEAPPHAVPAVAIG